MDTTIEYSSNKYKETDTVKLVGEHQVQEMVERNVRTELDKQYFHAKNN